MTFRNALQVHIYKEWFLPKLLMGFWDGPEEWRTPWLTCEVNVGGDVGRNFPAHFFGATSAGTVEYSKLIELLHRDKGMMISLKDLMAIVADMGRCMKARCQENNFSVPWDDLCTLLVILGMRNGSIGTCPGLNDVVKAAGWRQILLQHFYNNAIYPECLSVYLSLSQAIQFDGWNVLVYTQQALEEPGIAELLENHAQNHPDKCYIVVGERKDEDETNKTR